MKIVISEKQLENLYDQVRGNVEINEEGDETSGAYPDVGKWESGVTRGPANQIGNTKWEDSVKIERGKANKLK